MRVKTMSSFVCLGTNTNRTTALFAVSAVLAIFQNLIYKLQGTLSDVVCSSTKVIKSDSKFCYTSLLLISEGYTKECYSCTVQFM